MKLLNKLNHLCLRRLIVINIVLNEKTLVEKILETKELEGSIPYTATLLAKYYIHEKDLEPAQVYKIINEFLKESCESYREAKWYSCIDEIIHKAKKYPLVEIDSLPIYESEMETINGLENLRDQKILFTALCLAKYYNALNPQNNNWVNTDYKDLFSLGNTVGTRERRCQIIGRLFRSDCITMSKKVNSLNFSVDILVDSGDVALEITDFKNLGNRYLHFIGYPEISVCSCCGEPFRDISKKKKHRKGRLRQYCTSCKNEMQLNRYTKYYNSDKK